MCNLPSQGGAPRRALSMSGHPSCHTTTKLLLLLCSREEEACASAPARAPSPRPRTSSRSSTLPLGPRPLAGRVQGAGLTTPPRQLQIADLVVEAHRRCALLLVNAAEGGRTAMWALMMQRALMMQSLASEQPWRWAWRCGVGAEVEATLFVHMSSLAYCLASAAPDSARLPVPAYCQRAGVLPAGL